MTDDEVEALFARASRLASAVPVEMRGAAFTIAMGLITAGQATGRPLDTRAAHPQPTRVARAAKPEGEASAEPLAMLTALRRDQAAGVDTEERAIGKAMALLRVAYDELQIDGLTAPQVAALLTNKFRWRVSRQAIQQAFDTAGPMVDRRVVRGKATTYHLMKAGEEWLDMPSGERPPGGAARRRK